MLRPAVLAALLVPGLAGARTLLPLPVVAESVDATTLAEIQAALDDALAGLPDVERVPAGGPTFCAATDPRCIADAGRRAGAGEVLHVSARPLGDTVSLLLLLVESEGARSRKVAEALRPGVRAGPAVRAAVVRLVAPERWVGSLSVEAAPGSEIWVDGQQVALAPAPPIHRLTPGQHLLRVVRPGGGEARAYVDVRFDAVTKVRVEPRSDQVLVLGFAADAPVLAPAAATEMPAPQPAQRSGWRLPLAWSLLGGGAAALVAGLVTAGSASSKAEERAGLRRDGTFSDPAAAQDLADSFDTRRTVAGALLIGGGVLLAGGGTLLSLELLDAGSGGALELRGVW